MKEADIIVSGVKLSEGQSLAVRVAIEQFWQWCSMNNKALGAELATNYMDRLEEVREYIARTAR